MSIGSIPFDEVVIVCRAFLCNSYSDFTMTVWGLFFSLVCGYFLGCLPYVVLDFLKLPGIERYKVQNLRYPSKAVSVLKELFLGD